MGYKVTRAEASREKFQTFEDLEVYKTVRELRKIDDIDKLLPL